MASARTVLNQVNIVSGNVDASIEFYRRLGVEIPRDAVWRTDSGAHHVNAAADGVGGKSLEIDSAALAPHWNAGWRGCGDLAGRVVVGLSVPTREDVDRLYDEVTSAGYRGLQPPWDAFWGARYAIVEDPDGVSVGLMSPVSADKRSPPPEL
jgi:catechol 2,3-dioxygenase-like lactoylglutathione lyase family enzyme